MRKTLLVTLLLLATTAACATKGQQGAGGEVDPGTTTDDLKPDNGNDDITKFPTGPSLSPTSSYIRYIGRVQTDAPGGVRLGWPGSGFRVRVTNATKLQAKVQPNQYGENNMLAVLVDGKQTQLFPVRGTYQGELQLTLNVSVPSGDHIVSVVKRTEAGNGQVLLSELSTDGQFEEIVENGRLIEVVGENAAAGFSVDSVNGATTCPPTVNFVAEPNQQNAAGTFGVLAANAFNANWSIIAWSGRGVVQNYDGSTGTNIVDLYPRTNPLDTTKIDTMTTGAGAVIVNVGVNDISYWMQNKVGVTADTDGFTKAYVSLLQSIRKRNPQAAIIAALASTVIDGQCVGSTAANYSCTGGGQPARTLLRTITRAAVNQLNASGDNKVSFIEFAADSTNVGACYMPSAAGHAVMANTIIPAISAGTGWAVGSGAPTQPPAAKSGTGPAKLSGTFTPWPDVVTVGAQDPCSGINNKEFPQCHYCSPTLYNANNVGTAACPTLVGKQYACAGYCHVPDGFTEPYATNPPTSGNHYATPALIQSSSVALTRGRWIHSQEHGTIVLTYNCPNGCPTEVGLLNQLYNKYKPANPSTAQAWVIVTPSPELPEGTFAASTWTWSQTWDKFDAAAMQMADCFILQHAFYGRECLNDGSTANPRACPNLSDKPMFTSGG